jgi:hypothetical protein
LPAKGNPHYIKYETGIAQKRLFLTLQTRKISGPAGILFEIRRTTLGPLTLFTFGDVFELAALKKGLHSDFPAAGGTKELLGGAGRTGIFT